MFGENHEFDFGGWLRRARERAGLSLEVIARETKVSTSRVRALERNDLSGWPGGIFRRGFVRMYAELVGLDPDDAVTAFVRAFPEEETAADTSRPMASDAGLRLVLAEDLPRRHPMLARAGAALTDGLAPLVLAAPSGYLGGASMFWIVLAVVAVSYLVVGTLILGATPGVRMMQRATAPTHRRRPRPAASTRTVTEAGDEAPIEAEVSPAHR